jgi:uncharacterized protein YigE (DUF2233 family)
VKHRTVEYDVQEVQPGRWRWDIYPGNRAGQGRRSFNRANWQSKPAMARSMMALNGLGARRAS